MEEVHIEPDGNDKSLWNLFFEDLSAFDVAREKGIYFTLLGSAGYHALVLTKRGRSNMTQSYWEYIQSSLKKPHKIDKARGEITFPHAEPGLSRVLNIQNFLHTRKYHDVVFADPDDLVQEYANESTMYSITLHTYGDDMRAYYEKCRRSNVQNGGDYFKGYRCALSFLVGDQQRNINIVPWALMTWPF